MKMIEYNEKVHKKIARAGHAGMVLGIITIVVGVAIGTLSIIFASNAIGANKHLID
jgi:CHASE3 domain sensor protein